MLRLNPTRLVVSSLFFPILNVQSATVVETFNPFATAEYRQNDGGTSEFASISAGAGAGRVGNTFGGSNTVRSTWMSFDLNTSPPPDHPTLLSASLDFVILQSGVNTVADDLFEVLGLASPTAASPTATSLSYNDSAYTSIGSIAATLPESLTTTANDGSVRTDGDSYGVPAAGDYRPLLGWQGLDGQPLGGYSFYDNPADGNGIPAGNFAVSNQAITEATVRLDLDPTFISGAVSSGQELALLFGSDFDANALPDNSLRFLEIALGADPGGTVASNNLYVPVLTLTWIPEPSSATLLMLGFSATILGCRRRPCTV